MFIQVIDFKTDRFDEVRALVDDYRSTTQDRRTARRGILTKSRDDDNRYVNIVFFESYEEAMKNSEMPETSAFAEQMMKLCDGPATFSNLDVLIDETL
ncbi:MAG: hypothetical protein JF597_52775 [Streptomyces sp.]|uniref:hypothetical protein n=1 Tax=Streptomyces sp. TaxID=1931 RepID=UPI0025DE1605|nr:hypothetical protein [Streptomyces sp.]MBW8801902.1 hypothetical protein [Streptomyces sp.]